MFIIKKCWLVSSVESLWGNFMRAKYQIPTSPIFWNGPLRCSPEWREMVDARFMFARRCGWTIGEEEVSFWFDNWDADFNYEALAVEGFCSDKLCDFWMGED